MGGEPNVPFFLTESGKLAKLKNTAESLLYNAKSKGLAEALEEHLDQGSCSWWGLRSRTDVLYNLQRWAVTLLSAHSFQSARFFSQTLTCKLWTHKKQQQEKKNNIWSKEGFCGLDRRLGHSGNKWTVHVWTWKTKSCDLLPFPSLWNFSLCTQALACQRRQHLTHFGTLALSHSVTTGEVFSSFEFYYFIMYQQPSDVGITSESCKLKNIFFNIFPMWSSSKSFYIMQSFTLSYQMQWNCAGFCSLRPQSSL